MANKIKIYILEKEADNLASINNLNLNAEKPFDEQIEKLHKKILSSMFSLKINKIPI